MSNEPNRRTWYIEARVGSDNHRGECIRFLDRNSINRPVDTVLAEAFAEVDRLRVALVAIRDLAIAQMKVAAPNALKLAAIADRALRGEDAGT